jgi:hypothetical protein
MFAYSRNLRKIYLNLAFIQFLSCIHINLFAMDRVMTFNATFNNISAISWQSALVVEEIGVSWENHRPVASHWENSLSHNVVSSILRLRGIRTHNFRCDYWINDLAFKCFGFELTRWRLLQKRVVRPNLDIYVSHWENSLSHNVVSSILRLRGIRTHNFRCDRHWWHR